MKSKYKRLPDKAIKQWSYSRYGCYQQCPLKAKYKFVDKIKEPSSYPMERGLKIHALAESFVNDRIKGMPKDLAKFATEFRNVRDLHLNNSEVRVFTEIDLAVAKGSNGWIPSKYNDWGSVWCRGNADLLVLTEGIATNIDHKTGKQYDAHLEQGELYSINVMVHHYKIKRVDAEFWYLDSGEVDGASFLRKDLRKLQLKWEKKVAPMLIDTKFKATPNKYCYNCFFSTSRGGPCRER